MIVATEGVTLLAASVLVETRPLAHPGMHSIRSDNPARTHQAFSQPYTIGMEPGDNGLPKQVDPRSCGSLDHQAMQPGSAYADALPDRKTGLHFHARTDKTDATERVGIFPRNLYPEIGQRGYAVRHQTFPAGLVDGRDRAIGNHYIEAMLAGCDRCRETSRSSTDYENVSVPPPG